jgi:glycolate oxidase FAD binding subunit
VIYPGLSEAHAVEVMAAALNSPHEVSAAGHLPPPFAARASAAAGLPAGKSVTALRVEGPHPSVAFRSQALQT